MTKRTIGISIIGCLNNCIRDYNEKLRTLRDLLNDSCVRDCIEDEIKDYLGDGNNESLTVDDVLNDFFDQDHGMIKIGAMLVSDLQKAKFGDFSKMEILQADTDDEKASIKQIVDLLQ